MIFDFDSTIADSVEVALHVYNQLAPQYKSDQVSLEEIPSLLALGYAKAARAKHIRWHVIPQLLVHARREMRAHMGDIKPYPGITECVEELRADGHTIGILTSNREDSVRDFLAKNKLPTFDFIISEKSLFGKDRALKKIMRARGLTTADTIYIGDETRDVAACRKIGVPVIGVAWGLAGEIGFAKVTPDYLVRNTNELLAAIKSLDQSA